MIDMKTEINSQKSNKLGWLAGSGFLGAFGAFVGASCCVLPLVLFNLGVSSAAIAQLAFFAVHRNELLMVSLGLIVLAVWFAFRAGRRLPKRTVIILCSASVLVMAAYIVPFYEADLLILFGLRG